MVPQDGTTTDDEKNLLVRARFLVVFHSCWLQVSELGS